jgi:hypothetical protein
VGNRTPAEIPATGQADNLTPSRHPAVAHRYYNANAAPTVISLEVDAALALTATAA